MIWLVVFCVLGVLAIIGLCVAACAYPDDDQDVGGHF